MKIHYRLTFSGKLELSEDERTGSEEFSAEDIEEIRRINNLPESMPAIGVAKFGLYGQEKTVVRNGKEYNIGTPQSVDVWSEKYGIWI